METLTPVINVNSAKLIPAKIGGIDYYVNGTVYQDGTNNPLPGVTIFIKDGNTGTTLYQVPDLTGNDGTFWFSITNSNPDFSYYAVFTKPGFQDYETPVIGLLSNADIFLTPDSTNKNLMPVLGISLIALALMNKKQKVGANAQTHDIINIGLIVGGAFILTRSINIVDQLLSFLGLSKSKETQTIDFASSDPNSFWNPNFWRQFTTFTYAINQQQAEAIIQQLKDAFGWFNDNESAAIAALKQLRTQSNLSYLAYVFQQTDQQDLLTWLRGDAYPNDRLSDAEVYEVHSYFSKLPTH